MIHILSGPIKSGKTTRLQRWAEQISHVDGILTPDKEGLRQMFHISPQTYYPFQVPNEVYEESLHTQVGRFTFYESAFKMANALLLDCIYKPTRWIVVDEVGKLELTHKGLHMAVEQLVLHQQLEINVINWSNRPATASPNVSVASPQADDINLLLVIRDYLLAEVIDFYGIERYVMFAEDA